MAEFVLVHGAWHGGWCWRDVADGLRGLGHRVLTPTLTGLGERAHLLTADTGVSTHLNDVLAVIEWEELRDVILVGHSYGARPTALATAHPSVRRWVSLDGVPVSDGATLFDGVPADEIDVLKSSSGQSLAMAPFPPDAIGVPADHPGHGWVARRQTPMPWRCLEEPLPPVPERFATIPKTFVRALGNMLDAPAAGSRQALAEGWTVIDIDSGHDLMVTAPHETISALASLTS